MTAEPLAAPAAASGADMIVARMMRLPFTGLHWRTCFWIALGQFFDSFDSLILASVVAVIVVSMHISFADVGLLFSAAFVGMLFGSIICGWLSEVVGRKTVVIWTVGLFGALSIAAAFASSFNSLLAIRLIQGLALGGEVPIAGVLYGEFLPGKSRGPAVFYGQTVLFALGIFLAPLVGLACVAIFGPALGWRVLFLAGGFALPVAIAQYYLVPESPRWLAAKGRVPEADAIVGRYEARARAEGRDLPTPAAQYAADQRSTRLGELFQGIYAMRTVVIWLHCLVTYFCLYGLTVWLPTLYVKIGGLPTRDALGLSVVFGGFLVLTSFIWGAIGDRIGRKGGLILGYALCVLGFGLGIFSIYVLGITGWPMLLAMSAIAGAGANFNAAACYLYAVELFPTRMRGWATSTGGAANRIGSFIAPSVIGAMLGADLGIGSVLIMLTVVAAIGLGVAIGLGPETARRALEEVSV